MYSIISIHFRALVGLLLMLIVYACQTPAQQVVCPVSVPAQRIVCPVSKAIEEKPWILHHPPVPQARRAPIPIYAEVQPRTGIDTVYLFYRGTGQKAFERVRMVPYRSGFAFYISCMKVWEPRVDYYIVAIGGDCVLATAGTAEFPLEAKVVTSLDGPSPALPGTPWFSYSPGSCSEVDCPPGISEELCEKPLYRAQGEACETDRDCQPGLMYKDEHCVIAVETADELLDNNK